MCRLLALCFVLALQIFDPIFQSIIASLRYWLDTLARASEQCLHSLALRLYIEQSQVVCLGFDVRFELTRLLNSTPLPPFDKLRQVKLCFFT